MAILSNKDLEIFILRLRELARTGKIVIPDLESVSKFKDSERKLLPILLQEKVKDKELFSSVMSFDKEETHSNLSDDIISKGIFLPFFILPDFEGVDYTE